jgi:hypothetical protein
MKIKNNNIFFSTIFLVVMSFTLNSCGKKFDEASYAPIFKIGGYAHTNEVAANNLVGYWAFEGSIYDSVSNTPGTGVNNTFIDGYVGHAYQGAANAYAYCDISNALKNLDGSFTMNFWMYYNSAAVASCGSNWVHFVSLIDPSTTANTFDPKFQFLQYGAGNNGPSTWQFGSVIQNSRNGAAFFGGNLWTALNTFKDKWVNWSLVYDATSSTYNIYVNGSQWASEGWVDGNTGWGGNTYPQSDNSGSPFGNVKFGSISKIVFGGLNTTGIEATGPWGNDPAYFSGALDEIRIYNTALTQKQIQTMLSLMAKGL